MKQDGMQNFTIRIAADSLNLDSLKNHFKKNLFEADIVTPVLVERIKFTPFNFRNGLPPLPRHFEGPGEFTISFKKKSNFSDTLSTEPVSLNPGKLYMASLVGVRFNVLKKIMPQILFSAFLTLLTAAAFVVLYRNLKAQQRLMELKNDFISNITHELKTPVTTVGVAIEALKSFSAKDNPNLTEEYLDMAKRELDRLASMTDKILDVSIFESRGVQFEPKETDIDSIVQEMMSTMKIIFEKRGAQVTYSKEGENFKIQGSAIHLTNVIYNLVDNALKYSLEKPNIHINLKGQKQKLVLSVQDNGIGIASEFRHKIFEKFFRIPSGNIHNSKGYGLGLHYVASVVKSHYGVIDVISKPNEGSTFIIDIPRPLGKIFRKKIALWQTKNQSSSETSTS